MTPSSRLIVFGRVLLLLIAAGAVVTSVILGRRDDRSAAEPGGRYVCPMHPDVTSTTPGECPICRMDLELVTGRETAITLKPPTSSGNTASYEIPRRRVFQQDVRAPAWVDSDGSVAAIVYKDELATIMPEDRGVFAPSALPNAGVDVELVRAPAAPWDRSSARVRFVARADVSLHPGDVGWVRLPAKRREVLVIPSYGVLQSPEGPYVLVASGDGKSLAKRSIEVGRTFGGLAVVISGLRAHERVLLRSTFFVDAERRQERDPSAGVAP